MGRPIITEDGCIPGAGDFQTGTLNIGAAEISDTAGYSMSACGRGSSREPGAESWTAHTPALTFRLSGETQRAGAWLNVSNQRTSLCIIKENMRWIYQPFSPIYQQQAAAVWRKSIHPSKAAFCFGINSNVFPGLWLIFPAMVATLLILIIQSLFFIFQTKEHDLKYMVTSRHTSQLAYMDFNELCDQSF